MKTLVSRKVFFTWPLIVALVSCTVKAAGYGDLCETDDDCTDTGTSCADTVICSCDQTHFEANSLCNQRVLNGQSCSSTITDELQCHADYAHCAMDSEGAYKCLCKSGYFQTAATSCTPKRIEGYACSNTDQCIDYAECVTPSEGGSDKCKCTVGYRFTQSTSTCDSASGSSRLVIDAFLICVINLMGVIISSVFV